MDQLPPDLDGAYSRFLSNREGIDRLHDEVIQRLKDHEVGIDPAFRAGFRATLPFFRLLGDEQQMQLRGLFAHLLPSRSIPVDKYSRDEKVELDLLAETYIGQARAFAELMSQYEFDIAHQTRRDAGGVIIALSLSGSIFFLGNPDEGLGRSYRYSNIYGNRKVEPAGSCVLKSHPRIGHRLRTDQFRSTTLLLLAVHPSDVADDEDLASLSESVHTGISSRMAEISRVSRNLLDEASRPGSNAGEQADDERPATKSGEHRAPPPANLETGSIAVKDVLEWQNSNDDD